MFIWDFVADKILGQIVDWFYSQIVGFLGNFFSEMGNMGAELFTMDWVQSIVQQSLCYTTTPPVADRWVIVSINYGAEFARPRGCKNARVYTPAPLAETRSF